MHVPKSTFRVRADKPDWRDLSYDKIRADEPRPYVDLRQWCSPIEDQLHLGSCVGQAIVGAYELMLNQLFPDRFEDLSRLFVYFNARLLDGYVDEDVGTYVRTGIKAVNKYGVCNETIWPYIVEKFSVPPTVDSYTDAKKRLIKKYYRIHSADDMVDALNANYPVVISMNVYDSFYYLDYPNTDTMTMPEQWEEVIGGHAVTLVGYDLAKKQFLVRNSFGTDWGDNGYFWMPFEYVPNNVMDCWMFDIELASLNPVVAPGKIR